MNDVPALFFEGVVSQFFFKEALLPASALAGLLGHVASEVYAKRCFQYMKMTNGRLEKEIYFNYELQERDIETLSKWNLHYIGIAIHAGEADYSTDPETMDRLLSATKGKHVLLSLRTPNIGKEVAKCVESIRLVFQLHVCTKITSDVLKMMRSQVEKNTLNTLMIGEDAEIEEETAQLLVDLLKQKQFHEMFLRAECTAALKTIIASWRENSEEMVGKMIYYRGELSELHLSSTEFPFEECTEEEERDAQRAFYIPGHWPKCHRKVGAEKPEWKRGLLFVDGVLSLYKTQFVFLSRRSSNCWRLIKYV